MVSVLHNVCFPLDLDLCRRFALHFVKDPCECGWAGWVKFAYAKLIQLGYPEDIDFGELCVDFYVCRVAQCVPVSFGSLSVS